MGEFIGPYLVYTCIYGKEMNNVIEVAGEEPFAKGQNRRDLQVWYDAGDAETQFIEAIDSAYDFFRFLQVLTRGIADNQQRLIEDGNEHP
jgi:hypothetical protein